MSTGCGGMSSADWLSTLAFPSHASSLVGMYVQPSNNLNHYANLQQVLQQQAVQQAANRPSPQSAPTPPTPKRKGHMFKDLFGDLQTYIKENRDLIFSIVFVLVLDEYVFEGAFRERIKSVIEGVLKKVERKTGIDIPGV